jgi:hypothetical protein
MASLVRWAPFADLDIMDRRMRRVLEDLGVAGASASDIRRVGDGNSPGGLTTSSPMSVVVTVPTLSELTLAGGGNIVVDGIKTQSLTVTLSGGGNLTGSGTAGSLGVTLSGSGNVWFTGLVADNVQAVLSGSGNIFVTATKSVDASVPGSGTINYAGNPKHVTKSVMGSGAITGS